MKRAIWYSFLLFMVSFTFATACAPRAGPTQAPAVAPLASSPTSEPASRTAQAVNPEDAAWDKVVDAAKKEGKVNVYSFYFTGDEGLAITKAFKQRYGITLDIITGRGAEFIERLKVERRTGQITGELLEGSGTHVTNTKLAGLTIASVGQLPIMRETKTWLIDPRIWDPEGHVIAYSPSKSPPYINTNLLKPGQEPKSWKELLEPKWKGKMVIADPAISGNPYRLLAYVKRGIFNMEYMKALGRQDLRFSTGTVNEAQILSRGEVPLSLYNTSSSVASFIREGAPIKAIPMEEGVLAVMVAYAVIKDSPHPNAALLLANWLLSAEGQETYARIRGTDTVRADVPDFSPPGAVPPPGTKYVVLTNEDLEEQGKQFQDKSLIKLWKP